MNYQKILDETIKEIQLNNKIPKLLIHSCCAPCSSYCLEYLSEFFEITVVYYNPNIFPKEEYLYRMDEQKRFIESFPAKNPIKLIETPYTPEDFYSIAKGYEDEPEGGERCARCFKLRLEYTAKMAKEMNMDYFTTTLSISPLKNAEKLNTIGIGLSEIYEVPYLLSDFKKRNGYKRSVELSKEYDMYRQNFCGCVYSMREAKERENSSSTVEDIKNV